MLRSTAFEAKPADLIRAAKELELQGIIAKRKGSVYEPGGGAARGLSSSSIGRGSSSSEATLRVILSTR